MSGIVGNESWIPADLRGKSKGELSSSDKKRYNQAKRTFLGDDEYMRRKEAHARRRRAQASGEADAGGAGDDDDEDEAGNESGSFSLPASALEALAATAPWVTTFVFIESGAGLAPKDKNGLSDPYVLISCPGSRFKAKTSVKPKTLNPVWKERVAVPRELTPQSVLHFECYDKDKAGRDDFEGQFDIDVSSFAVGDLMRITVPLQERGKKKEVVSGTITIAVLKSSEALTATAVTPTRVSVVDLSGTPPSATPFFAQGILPPGATRAPGSPGSATGAASGASVPAADEAATPADVEGDADDDAPEDDGWASTVLVFESGEGLAPKDKSGVSDPYCKLICAGSGFKAKTSVKKKTLNPVWNERIVLARESTPDALIRCEVWDRDKTGRDDFEGQFEIDLSALAIDTKVRQVFPLASRGRKGEVVTGSIAVSMMRSTQPPVGKTPTFTSLAEEDPAADRDVDGDEDDDEPAADAGAAAADEPAVEWHSTTVFVESCANLAAKDRNGASDPWVKVVCPGSGLKGKTSVKKKTLNPVWNEKIVFARDATPLNTLHFEVWDRDRTGSDDFEGQANMDLAALPLNAMVRRTLTLESRGKKGEVITGSLTVTVWKSTEDAPPPSRLAEEDEPADRDVEGDADDDAPAGESAVDWHSTIVVIETGLELAPKDKNGLSDPYVRITCPGSNFKARSSVQKKTVNPVWNERVCIPREDTPQDTLHVEVWDRDRTGRDDFEGQFDVDLRQFPLDARERQTFILEGRGKKNEVVTGTITLMIMRSVNDPTAPPPAPVDDGDVEGDAEDDEDEAPAAPAAAPTRALAAEASARAPAPAPRTAAAPAPMSPASTTMAAELARLRDERDAAIHAAEEMRSRLEATQRAATEVPREAASEIARLRAELAEERRLNSLMADPNELAHVQRQLRATEARLVACQQQLHDNEALLVEAEERTARAKRRAQIAQEVLAAAVGDNE